MRRLFSSWKVSGKMPETKNAHSKVQNQKENSDG